MSAQRLARPAILRARLFARGHALRCVPGLGARCERSLLAQGGDARRCVRRHRFARHVPGTAAERQGGDRYEEREQQAEQAEHDGVTTRAHDEGQIAPCPHLV
jgi:hypothetical protein